MKHHMWTLALFFFVTLCSFTESRTLTKRQIHGEAAVAGHVGGWQDKAKVEAKWGVKNALIGFVFNKINSFIDQKTHWIDQLDKTNIAKNKLHGIYAPKDPAISLTHIITDKVGQTLQAAGPFIGVVVQKLTSSSGGLLGGGSAQASAPAVADHGGVGIGGGFGIGNILGSLSAVKGGGYGRR